MSKLYRVCIVGATGMVGQTMLEVLETRNFPISNLELFASEKSSGKKTKFKDQVLTIQALNEHSFDEGFDFAFFAVDAHLAKIYAPLAKQKGSIVIDNSNAFRMNEDVKLIVPEVNGHVLSSEDRLIANPNCSTIQCMLPLQIIDELFDLVHISYTTYQSVSGSGHDGVNELSLSKQGKAPQKYPKIIHENVIPQIDTFDISGFTKEELKMIHETRKILNKKVDVDATCVRVPVIVGHSVSIQVETKKTIDLNLLKTHYQKDHHLVLYQDHDYPTPKDVLGDDRIFIGRVRKSFYKDNQVLLWVVADNVRKGAATNAIEIAEYIIKEIK